MLGEEFGKVSVAAPNAQALANSVTPQNSSRERWKARALPVNMAGWSGL
jgi:hypothetical protein